MVPYLAELVLVSAGWARLLVGAARQTEVSRSADERRGGADILSLRAVVPGVALSGVIAHTVRVAVHSCQ